jgi:hypothetical protein
VKLLDFGVAGLTHDPRYTVTRRGRPLPRHSAYLSPEQVAGMPADARSDVFALGTVLWEMLTSRRLFAGDNERKTLANVTRAEIPAPSRVVGGIPAELDRVVLAALSRDRARRYRDAGKLAGDLEEIMGALPSRHDDLTALLERVWGSPRDTGPVRTLVGDASALRPPPPPPSRPAMTRVPTPPRAVVEVRPPPEREPTRLMNDSTLAALLGREPPPRPRPRSWVRWLIDPRALVLGAAGLIAGVIISAATLDREARPPDPTGTAEVRTGDPSGTAERPASPPPSPVASPVASPPPAPVAPPPAVTLPPPPLSPCESPDAGIPCRGTPVAPPPAAPAKAPEARGSRPERRAPRGRPSPSEPPRRPDSGRGALDDRRPNPFGE